MKVLLGLSGGVDSAVAAYLLKKQGHEVSGCFMRNWDALANGDYLGNPTINNNQCPQEKDYDDAVLVAKMLDIPLLRIDFVKEYWDDVFSYLIREYEAGRTPNPDIFCNKYIKFDAFLKFAKEKGFDSIAMGHYAKHIDKDGKAYLCKSFDKLKGLFRGASPTVDGSIDAPYSSTLVGALQSHTILILCPVSAIG